MNRFLLPPLLLLALASGCRDSEANRSAGAAAAEPRSVAATRPLPPLTGRVMDGADILSAATENYAGARSGALEAKTSDQLVVVTVPSLDGETIEDFGGRLGNGWGLGRKGLNNGVLLIVAPSERTTRISVGNGLEGLLTDGRARKIVEAMVARFKDRDFDRGVRVGVEEIVRNLESDTRRPMPLDLSKVA